MITVVVFKNGPFVELVFPTTFYNHSVDLMTAWDPEGGHSAAHEDWFREKKKHQVRDISVASAVVQQYCDAHHESFSEYEIVTGKIQYNKYRKYRADFINKYYATDFVSAKPQKVFNDFIPAR